MVDEALFSSAETEWGTPLEYFRAWDDEFWFELDAAASHENHKANLYYTKADNGLALPWSGYRTFVNPPYGRGWKACTPTCTRRTCEKRGYHIYEDIPGVEDWVRKAHAEFLLGGFVVMLLPARTDTRWWREYVWDNINHRPRPGIEVRFLPGRLRFELPDGKRESAPFPSVLVIFDGKYTGRNEGSSCCGRRGETELGKQIEASQSRLNAGVLTGWSDGEPVVYALEYSSGKPRRHPVGGPHAVLEYSVDEAIIQMTLRGEPPRLYVTCMDPSKAITVIPESSNAIQVRVQDTW